MSQTDDGANVECAWENIHGDADAGGIHSAIHSDIFERKRRKKILKLGLYNRISLS